MKRYIHIGDRFGRLMVIGKGHSIPNRCYYWVHCDCGSNPKEVEGNSLLQGLTTSCGCLHREKVREVGKANRKYAKCYFCNETNLVNQGLCYKHYLAWKRKGLEFDIWYSSRINKNSPVYRAIPEKATMSQYEQKGFLDVIIHLFAIMIITPRK